MADTMQIYLEAFTPMIVFTVIWGLFILIAVKE